MSALLARLAPAGGRARTPLVLAAIILGNLVPVFGVLFLGWDGAQILILYWGETLIAGAIAFLRILSCGAGQPFSLGRLTGNAAIAAFFTVHYGMFCAVHGMFAFTMAADAVGGGRADVWTRTFGDKDFLWALAAVGLLHLIAFGREWVFAGRWRDAQPNTVMFEPYGRIIVLHLTILGGAWVLGAVSAPVALVLTLCAFKMAVELAASRFVDWFRDAAMPK